MTRALLVALTLTSCASDPEAPVSSEPATSDSAEDTGTPSLPAVAGTFREQALEVDGETRFYLLHVPDTAGPYPVLFDFHGTAGGGAVPAEEAYGLDAAISAAEANGFVLVRPRSRSMSSPGYEVYRWDQNPGDPDRNTDFALALLEALAEDLPLDLDRVHAMGFSSGTNQAAMLAELDDSPFAGFGHVGGGAWHSEAQRVRGRVWMATPYRDYMRAYHHELVRQLDAAGHPETDRLHRPSMSGHELYDGMYEELWAWLDRGERPEEGTGLGAGWSVATAPPALAAWADGVDVLLAGPETLGRWDGTAFVASTVVGSSRIPDAELTGVCLTEGRGMAVGNGAVLWTKDGGVSFTHLDVDEPGPAMFGYAHWTGVGCDQGTVRGVGYWSAGDTTDGRVFTDVPFDLGGYRAQATTTTGHEGSWVSVGYYKFLAEGTQEQPWRQLGPASWLLDAAPTLDGGWVAVGDHGTVLRQADDGWDVVDRLGADVELGAVAIRDDGVGLAVGRQGAAFRSDDAGMSWTPVPLGEGRLLADVVWRPDGSALVVGPEGSWRYTP